MQGRLVRRFIAVLLFVAVAVTATAFSGEVVSRMRTVSGVFEANGFLLNLVPDMDLPQGPDDLAAPVAVEIIRPNDEAITIGRLFTSCSCIRLESPKRSYGAGERAILYLRNVRPTPAAGQMYAVFVQLTGPTRATLRADAFVQTGVGIAARPDAVNAPAAAPAPAASQASTGITGNPVPGVNNELAAALTAVNAHPEATGDLLEEAATTAVEAAETLAAAPALQLPEGDDVRQSLGEARGDLEALFQADAQALSNSLNENVDAARQAVGALLDGETQAAQDLSADLGGDLSDFYTPAAAETPAETQEAAGQNAVATAENATPPDFDTAAIAAEEAARLTEEQIHQLQQLALLKAEEQARQLSEQVQRQIQELAPPATPETPLVAAPVDAGTTPTPAVAQPQAQTVPAPAPVPAAPEQAAAPAEPAESAAPVAPAHAVSPLTLRGPGPALVPNPVSRTRGMVGQPVQSVSLITIGVRDMAASVLFYEALGWQRAARGKYDQTAFFQLNGQVLALYPIADLLAEQNMSDATPAPGGITLALHVGAKEDVWTVYQRFIDAGGTSLRAPAEMASGAVSSYVSDPDGNPWEISWVPQFQIDANGGLWLP